MYIRKKEESDDRVKNYSSISLSLSLFKLTDEEGQIDHYQPVVVARHCFLIMYLRMMKLRRHAHPLFDQ